MRTRLPVMLLLLLATCGTAEKATPTEKATPIERPTGLRVVIAESDRVEAYRLVGNPARPYERKAGPVAVGAIDAIPLRGLVARLKTRPLDTGCAAKPGVELVFHRRTEEVHVYLCFGCTQVRMTTAVPTDYSVDFEKFDAERDDLLSILWRIFPDDQELSSL